jgi:hypothetical protein
MCCWKYWPRRGNEHSGSHNIREVTRKHAKFCKVLNYYIIHIIPTTTMDILNANTASKCLLQMSSWYSFYIQTQ